RVEAEGPLRLVDKFGPNALHRVRVNSTPGVLVIEALDSLDAEVGDERVSCLVGLQFHTADDVLEGLVEGLHTGIEVVGTPSQAQGIEGGSEGSLSVSEARIRLGARVVRSKVDRTD